MKIQYFFLFSLLILILFSACKKDQYKYEVTGRVTEFGTNDPIANADVFLLDCTTDGSSSNCDTAAILTTDAMGRYSSPFRSVAGRFPMITTVVPQYFPASEHFVTENRNNEIDFVLEPFAWLNLSVKNLAPSEEFDKIRIGYELGLGGWNEYIGSQVDENIFGLVRGGNKNAFIRWKIYKAGILEEEYRDTIYIPAHDTLYYEVTY